MFLFVEVLSAHPQPTPRTLEVRMVQSRQSTGCTRGLAQGAHGGWLLGPGAPAAFPAPFSPCNQTGVPRSLKGLQLEQAPIPSPGPRPSRRSQRPRPGPRPAEAPVPTAARAALAASSAPHSPHPSSTASARHTPDTHSSGGFPRKSLPTLPVCLLSPPPACLGTACALRQQASLPPGACPL